MSGLRALARITGGRIVIPNPRTGRVLEVDDRLTCFGKLASMRDLIPDRRRRRRPKLQPLPEEPISEPDDD